jgi:hypothetical protein
VDFGSLVLLESAVGGEHQHLIALALQVVDGVLEAGDNAVNFRQKGLSEESNSHRGWGEIGDEEEGGYADEDDGEVRRMRKRMWAKGSRLFTLSPFPYLLISPSFS